jgi:hypothetical protein
VIAKLFKSGLLPIALYFAGYVALTWPAIERFSTHTLGGSGDGFQNVWNSWWVRTALLERGAHVFHTDMLHHPGGVTLLAHTLTWTDRARDPTSHSHVSKQRRGRRRLRSARLATTNPRPAAAHPHRNAIQATPIAAVTRSSDQATRLMPRSCESCARERAVRSAREEKVRGGSREIREEVSPRGCIR